MKNKKTKITLIIWTLLMTACGSDPAATTCTEVEVENTTYCIVKQGIIVETGYQCPVSQENLYSIGDVNVCSPDNVPPSGEILDKIINERDRPNRLNCKSSETEVSSQSGCLQDDATCTQLASGRWCTSGSPALSCKSSETEVSSQSGCLQDDATCTQLAPGRWCTSGSPALSCKSSETEVSSQSACLQDDATCTQLAPGRWCTEGD